MRKENNRLSFVDFLRNFKSVPESPAHSATMGFSFNDNPFFAPVGEAFIAEFGADAHTTTGRKPLPHVGHRVSRIDVQSGQVHAFAVNRTGLPTSETNGGGFERPTDAVFDSNGALYIADFGLLTGGSAVPGTGVIWRITRET